MKQIAGIIVTAALILAGSYSLSAAEKKNVEKPVADVSARQEIITTNPPSPYGVDFHETRAPGWPVLPVSEVYDSPMLVDSEVNRETMKKLHDSGEFGDDPDERGFKTRQMIMWNLIEYLDLDEETAADFFPIFNEHNKKRIELTRQHMEIVSKIVADVSDESVSSNDLKAMVNKFEETAASIEKERKEFLEKSRKILDYRQFVKLVVFNDKLKKDLFNRFSRGDNSRMRSPGDNSSTYGGDKGKSDSELNNLEEVRKMLEKQQQKIEEQEKLIQKLRDQR